MKPLMKRLLAGLLTFALLNGIGTAFAVELKTYGTGHTTGATTNQGRPEELVNIVLPSVQEDFFDFILDPSNCIATTNAAAYNGIAYKEGNFYFKSMTEDGEVLLSPDSQPLSIINKGTVPVEVNVSLKVNKGAYAFSFADTSDFLDANGDAINGNAMYLALASGRRTAPVAASTNDSGQTVYSASLDSWIDATRGAHDVVWNEDTQTYAYVVKDGLTDNDFQSVSFYVTGAIQGDGWADADSGVALSVVWDIYYAQSSDTESPYSDPNLAPSVTVTTATRAPGENVVLRVDMGAGENLMTSVDSVSYLTSSGETANIVGLSVEALNFYTNAVTFSAPSDILTASDWKLCLSNSDGNTTEVAFDPVAEEADIDPTVTVTNKATAPGESAVITVDWGSGSKAMDSVSKVTYVNASGDAAEISGSDDITVSGNTVSVKLTNESITGTGFKLILSNASGETFEADVDLADYVDPGTDPTVTVTSKVTASGETARMTVDWGSGAKAMTSVSKLTYTKSNGVSASFATSSSYLNVSGNVVTFKFNATTIQGSNFILVLKNGNGTTAEFPVELIEGPDSGDDEPGVDPTVTVTSKASAAGDTATMTVDWGSGSKAMTKVSRVAYVNASGNADSVTSTTYLKTSGNVISLTFTAATIQGTDFKLVLTNASGATFEAPVDLVDASPESNDGAPTVTVTKKVTASGQTASMTVDWGSGSQAMTAVSKLKYTKSTGVSASYAPSSSYVNVKGNVVTFKFDSNSIKGSNFILILKNADGKTCELPVDLIESS